MNYEEALRLAEAIDATVTPDDPRLHRTVHMISTSNGSTNMWHNAFVVQFKQWYFVFTLYEGYWAFKHDEVSHMRQFGDIPVEEVSH